MHDKDEWNKNERCRKTKQNGTKSTNWLIFKNMLHKFSAFSDSKLYFVQESKQFT